MPFHLVAQLPNGGQKSVFNLTEDKALDHVTEFVRDQTLTTRWGNNTQTRQAYEMRVYETADAYSKRSSGPFADFIKGKRSVFGRLEKEARKRLEPRSNVRVFVVMPIQGDRWGKQSEQNVYREYNERFEVIEQTLQEFGCVAIRIDKEAPLGGLVDRIKEEIRRARFVVADLTDERPSCYFEAGYAEALNKPVIPVASKESVMRPGENTTIHFDIHQNVQFFTNHEELAEKLRDAVEKNRKALIEPEPTTDELLAAMLSASTEAAERKVFVPLFRSR